MTHEHQSKLQQIVSKRLDKLIQERFPKVRSSSATIFLSSPSRRHIKEEWSKLCKNLEIQRVVDWDQSLKDKVVVHDPMPDGDWLIMSQETALKILTLGMP